MPIARFQMPDGRIGRFEVPDGTTPEQAQQLISSGLDQGQQAPTVPRETSADNRAARVAAQQAADRAAYDPTKGMSGTQKFLAGAGKAISDTGRGIGQLVGMGLDAVTTPQLSTTDLVTGGKGTTLSQRLGLPQNADIAETERNDAPLMNTGAGLAGNITGHVIVALAPGSALRGAGAAAGAAGAGRVANGLRTAAQAVTAPESIGGAAALGAGFGALQPTTAGEDRLKNAVFGGVAGGGGQAAFNGLARVIRPNTSANVRLLMDEGVTPTPGQILGGAANRIEEGLQSLPIVGDSIRAARRRAQEDLNTAAFNRALAPLGQELPPGLTGRDAVAHTEQVLRDHYDAIMPHLTSHMDGQFINDIQSLRNGIGSGAIDPAYAQRFENILNNQVLTKFQGPHAIVSGETFKQIDSDLGNLWRQFRNSPDPDSRLLGDAIRETQDSLLRMARRSNPGAADALDAIDQGWANFKRAQRAASSVGAEEGQFSPAQLHNAVRATDRSKDHSAFSRGSALMQDLSEAGKTVLGAKVPDSGTPFRIATGAGAAGFLAHVEPAALGGALAASAAYSRPGQRLLAAALARRPAGAEPLANGLRAAGRALPIPSIAAHDAFIDSE